MGAARKLKISVTIDSDLLAGIDRQAAVTGGNRSAVIQRLLRGTDHDHALARLEESTAAYYDSLTATERADDAALARSSARAARRVAVDDPRPPASRARRRAG